MPYQALISPPVPRTNCPLFALLPTELRTAIFELTLSDYEDPDARYPADAPYARPGYFAPRRCDVSLLRTCRAVYRETWLMPAILYRHTIWRTSHRSRGLHPPPSGHTSKKKMMLAALRNLKRMKAKLNDHKPLQVENLQIFVEMEELHFRALSPGFLSSSGVLQPRRITITVCYFDWFNWENDERLWCCSKGLHEFCWNLPSSVKEIVMELETAPRKKHELDRIARRMCGLWFLSLARASPFSRTQLADPSK